MSDIINATYNLLDTLDNSSLINNLTKYKNNLMHNHKLLHEIEELKKISDNKVLIEKRKKLYENNDYKMYMKYYNELLLIIMKINNKYKEYTSTREHNC